MGSKEGNAAAISIKSRCNVYSERFKEKSMLNGMIIS